VSVCSQRRALQTHEAQTVRHRSARAGHHSMAAPSAGRLASSCSGWLVVWHDCYSVGLGIAARSTCVSCIDPATSSISTEMIRVTSSAWGFCCEMDGHGLKAAALDAVARASAHADAQMLWSDLRSEHAYLSVTSSLVHCGSSSNLQSRSHFIH